MNNNDEIFNMIKKEGEDNIESALYASRYYLKSFEKLSKGFFVFNMAAFLFGGIWMLYRRMYLLAFLFFMLSFFAPIPYILLTTFLGFGANALYFHTLKERFFDGKRTMGVNQWIIPTAVLCIMFLIYIGIGGSDILHNPYGIRSA